MYLCLRRERDGSSEGKRVRRGKTKGLRRDRYRTAVRLEVSVYEKKKEEGEAKEPSVRVYRTYRNTLRTTKAVYLSINLFLFIFSSRVLIQLVPFKSFKKIVSSILAKFLRSKVFFKNVKTQKIFPNWMLTISEIYITFRDLKKKN